MRRLIGTMILVQGWILVAYEASADDAVSVVLTLMEQAEVPSREAGIVTMIHVQDGDMIEQGAVLAQVDDRSAILGLRRSQAEYEHAKLLAHNDVRVRLARKTAELARSELTRAKESAERFKRSVSESEIDRLQLAVQKAELEIETAERDMESAKQQLTVREVEIAIAEEQIKRRRVISPLTGIVSQIHIRKGEWAEPGKSVIRVVRIDRLRAEGFLPAARATPAIVGRKVELVLDEPTETAESANGPPAGRIKNIGGKLTGVSPEINPLNGQTRVWAEIDNSSLQLRPGQTARMILLP